MPTVIRANSQYASQRKERVTKSENFPFGWLAAPSENCAKVTLRGKIRPNAHYDTCPKCTIVWFPHNNRKKKHELTSSSRRRAKDERTCRSTSFFVCNMIVLRSRNWCIQRVILCGVCGICSIGLITIIWLYTIWLYFTTEMFIYSHSYRDNCRLTLLKLNQLNARTKISSTYTRRFLSVGRMRMAAFGLFASIVEMSVWYCPKEFLRMLWWQTWHWHFNGCVHARTMLMLDFCIYSMYNQF